MDDDLPTPDELLLELMDLVALAFPEPLASMSIAFVEAEDRKRPGLTNLDGKARPGQPKRPPLGHDDKYVLDAINELITDFADATLRQGGVRVLTGRIDIADGPDGDRFVKLVEADGSTVMERRFDKSELRWLFWTAALFRALEQTATVEAAQRAAVDAALKGVDAFRIDMARGEIAFTAKGAPASTYSFALLGSWADETKRFLWGWANEQAPDRLKRAVDGVRTGAVDDGLRALTEPSFGCPEPCAERLARHAAARIGAVGVYRAPFASSQAKGFMYIALLQSEKIK